MRLTGQQEEGTAFGLYDYGMRFYSTVLGRFVSADPVSPRFGNPQTLDRYAYAIDNPLRYTDPTGLEAEWTTINNALQGLHRLADAMNQRSFMAWGQDLISRGVPADQVGNSMRLISEFATGCPETGLVSQATAFVGAASGSYYIVMLETGPEAGGSLPESIGWSGNVSFTVLARVELPSGGLPWGTGRVLVHIDDPGGCIRLQGSSLQVVFTTSTGKPVAVQADLSGDSGAVNDVYIDGKRYFQYDFGYATSMGHPMAVQFGPGGMSFTAGEHVITWLLTDKSYSVGGDTVNLNLVPF